MSGYSTMTAALLVLGVTSLAHAQQATSDSARSRSAQLARVRSRDQRAITTDTIRLHREIAIRDSARTMLDQDQARTHAIGTQIDSLKAVLDRERKATPRDTVAINRNLTALTGLRQKLDRSLDRERREKTRVDSLDSRVRKESDAAIDAHQDIKELRTRPRADSAASKTHR
jgi:hypothetical protein